MFPILAVRDAHRCAARLPARARFKLGNDELVRQISHPISTRISVWDFKGDGIHRRSFFRTILAQFPIRLASVVEGGTRPVLKHAPITGINGRVGRDSNSYVVPANFRIADRSGAIPPILQSETLLENHTCGFGFDVHLRPVVP